MSLILTNTQTQYEKPEPGTYNARCVNIIDLGTQETTYNGETKMAHQVMLRWELLDEKTSDGKPQLIGSRYTMSMHEKATLRKVLESWRGRAFTKEEEDGFDLANVLGKDCLINIVHNETNGKTYANVATVSAPMKGVSLASINTETPYVYLSLKDAEQPEFKETLFSLPDWIIEIIKKSLQWKDVCKHMDMPAAPAAVGTQVALDDDVPF